MGGEGIEGVEGWGGWVGKTTTWCTTYFKIASLVCVNIYIYICVCVYKYICHYVYMYVSHSGLRGSADAATAVPQLRCSG